MKIEICANSYQSAINAQKAGADRIELCSELAVGGITPSFGLISIVKEELRLPLHVLIRPRSGNFTYSKLEFEVIKKDIVMCKKLGCEGVVTGVLNDDNTIDLERTKELVELSKPMAFTFHRAFDWVDNPCDGLEGLIRIGVTRVLSSGQKVKAEEGISLLQKLNSMSDNRIEIMPGGGISKENIRKFKNAGFKQIHFSATTLFNIENEIKVSMNSKRFYDETKLAIADIEKIREVIKIINKNA
ncbi:UNVERIFIED_CONTAM: hypothetical protein GTU68_066829 [Idotea baltica]|nr:hypothetical protein [Idotea baltica]